MARRVRRKKHHHDKPMVGQSFVGDPPAGQTFALHNDNGKRKTLVHIDDKLYELVESELTMHDIRDLEGDQIPHIRRLNPIIKKSFPETMVGNAAAAFVHDLQSKSRVEPNKVTSVDKAIRMGVDVEGEVKRLLLKKEKARKEGDLKELKKIRKQLRKLDYKRYTEQGE